ncbi:hypothetical protein [Kitasatospora sp. NPDC058046]|uniref:hypothetical protein n=1 Tax=Kitasatospora sp. NPDC058046 TaxID=3346312 RepID=UPI0036D76C2A
MSAGTLNRRAYCRCTTVQNYDYAQAAAKLGCKVRYLQDRISKLPHQKHGESVAFCDCELLLIMQLGSVVPDNVVPLITPAPSSAESTAVADIRTIRPSGARKRAGR